MRTKLINNTSGANPLGPSNKARNAIRSRVSDISTLDIQCAVHLKSYIAKREGVHEANISLGCGSTAILNTVLGLAKAKRILIPYPISQRHSAILSRHSLESTTVALRVDESFDLNIDEFCKTMHGHDAALLSNPHDVTGSVISQEDMARVVDEADRLGLHLIVDEAYGDYTGLPSLAVRVADSRRSVILRTFSTFHALGGLRIGYIIGPQGLLSSFEAKLDPSLINSFAPFAAMASLKDKGYRHRTLLFIEGEKAYVREKLSRIQGVNCYVSPSNILVIRLQKDHSDFSGLFKKYHMLNHTFTDEDGNICIRFPVQTHRLNAYFVRTIIRIMEA